jgi:hypothetical protein
MIWVGRHLTERATSWPEVNHAQPGTGVWP